MTARKTTAQFKAELSRVNPDIEVLGEYKTSKSPIRVRCCVCGHEWEPQPGNLLGGSGCPVCSRKSSASKRRKTDAQYREELTKVNPSISLLSEYKGNSHKVTAKCLSCGYVWDVAPATLLDGHKCPKCAKGGTSYPELVIYEAFAAALGDDAVKWRDRSVIRRELDVYIPSIRCAVEYGAWFWHRNKLENDSTKRQLCVENGIRLITIYDQHFDDVVPFSDGCWCYSEVLGLDANSDLLRGIVYRLFVEFGIADDFSKVDFERVKIRARNASRRMTTDEFKEQLGDVLPNVEIVGDFCGMQNPIRCRCRICGHEWDSIPTRLMLGHGCRKCGRKVYAEKRKYSQEEYEAKLAKACPDVEVIGKYTLAKEPIRVRCKVCGHEWQPVAQTLLSSRGCPECAKRKRADSHRLTHGRFIEKYSSRFDPDVELVGRYVSWRTPIRVRCKRCGYEWDASVDMLLAGSKCRRCHAYRPGGQGAGYGHYRRANEEYVAELKRINPTLDSLEPFTKVDTKIMTRCRVCGHEWKARPAELLRGSGCPVCTNRKRAAHLNAANRKE